MHLGGLAHVRARAGWGRQVCRAEPAEEVRAIVHSEAPEIAPQGEPRGVHRVEVLGRRDKGQSAPPCRVVPMLSNLPLVRVVAPSDGDGAGDLCDVCPGFDDTADLDSDGVPDGCPGRIDLPRCTIGVRKAVLVYRTIRALLLCAFLSSPRSCTCR